MSRKPHGAGRIATVRRSAFKERRGDSTVPAAHTFVVRLWAETRDAAAGAPVWRGTVNDLRGRQLGSFSSVADLVGILGGMSGVTVLLRFSCAGMNSDRAPDTP